ncbi:class I SAM-dependent methyltransferase [Phosphitispora fastidiosa]|uniref:class I SAM-dependent methyltransferase n=1 Tax=Phosphitispora fastidiosa TaxID=2837202 RepID=UPI001E3074AF|nr:methyltransferase domain-containing protein [Phosphitispora fastidiosa]MBU7006962.1 ubiquinone/menaquinone biosynthesis C-methylase UbiE [Phosphitispora fastidiosa]
MEKDAVSILCSPETGAGLQLVSEEVPGRRGREALVDSGTGKKFVVREGIPLLLKDDQITGEGKKTRAFYNVIAPLYNVLHELQGRRKGGERKLRQKILSPLEIGEGNKVLEVSVGTGSNLPYLPPNANYYGVDISFPMLRQCAKLLKRHGISGNLVLGAAEYLPFKDNVFDCVFNVCGFRLFNDKSRAMGEMVRVAKPGARILIADQKRSGVPLDLIPRSASPANVSEIEEWELYCMVFRKKHL